MGTGLVSGTRTGLESAAVAPSSAATTAAAAIAAVVLCPVAVIVATASATILSRRPSVAVPAVVGAAAVRAAGSCPGVLPPSTVDSWPSAAPNYSCFQR
jgi:hypothetical protein